MTVPQYRVTSITKDDLGEQQDDGPSSSSSPFKSLLSQYSFRPSRTLQETVIGTRLQSQAAQHRASPSPQKRSKDDLEAKVSGSPTKRHKLAAIRPVFRNTPSPKKKSLPYAPPETYAHLHVIQDYVKPELDSECLLCHCLCVVKIRLRIRPLSVLFCGIK